MRQVSPYRWVRALSGWALRRLYRGVLAARYGGRVSAKSKLGAFPSVLIIRGDGGIGDFVLFLPALRILRRHYAGARLSLLVGSESGELASSFSEADEVISFQVRRYRFDLAYRVRLIQRLRGRRFDVAVNPIYSREPLTDELLYCSGARDRIVSAGDLNNIDARTKIANDWYCTRILPTSAGLLHESERNREFVEQLTSVRVSKEDLTASLPLSDSQLADAQTILSSCGLDTERDLIVVMCPGALNPVRVWPAERFARLGNLLARDFGARLILCGSSSERESAMAISELMNAAPVSLVGRTTLPQLAGILHYSSLYIGNESGPLHLAAAAGTPTVCILGGGHFGRFLPYPHGTKHRAVFESMACYHCNWQCIYQEPHCIRDIPVEKVWEAARSLMEEIVLPNRGRAAAGAT